MASISPTLARIQNDLERYVPESAILAACRNAKHRWRERLLGPVVTIHLFVLQVLAFNTKEMIMELYGIRWRVETHFAQLKTTLKMRKIKSQTEAGARKELVIYCLVYNLVHAIMLKVAAGKGVTPDRISFIDTVRWLLSAGPGDPLPDLIVNPKRPDRHEPRVRKDRNRSYPVMTKPRKQLRKALKTRRNR